MQRLPPRRPLLRYVFISLHISLFISLVQTSSNNSPSATRHMVLNQAFQIPLPIQSAFPYRSTTCPVSSQHTKFLIQPACVATDITTMPATIAPATRVPSTPLTRVQVAEALGDDATAVGEQVDKVTSLQFQQAINCCGLTSVAYALSAIGFPTTADDLFLQVGVDIESAVGDGMTLAEIYDASLRYINRSGIDAFVECYHFDTFISSEEGFRTACNADADGGIDDIVVLNFHSGIAHGWESGGGGHFSVMTALSKDSQDVIMADVHGIKYGTFWSTPVSQMYTAMANKDSCGRARGALRFGKKNSGLDRPLPGLKPTLLDWTSPPKPFRSESLQKHIPWRWDEALGARNMAGASVLSNAVRVLEGDDSIYTRLDEIMRKLSESYTKHLNNFLSADEVAEMANKLQSKGVTKATATVKTLAACNGLSLLKTLREIGCGEDGVAVMVAYDFNEAYGAPLVAKEKGEAGALSHGIKTWSLIADVNPEISTSDTGGIVIAPAMNVILAGRLWTTSADRMAVAMRCILGVKCQVVVLDSR